MMFPFARTLGSVTKADLLGLMLACAGLAVAVVFVAVGSLTWLTAHLVNIQIGWLDSLVNWLAGGILGIAGWFMLPAIIVLVAGVFQERTIHRVELAYYPDEVRTQEPRFWPDLKHDLRFTMRALLLNVLVLPLYLFGIGFIVSVVLNSYLLGREFFESAAGYHIGKPQAKTVGQQNKAAVYGGGLVITLMTLAPVINIFVPIFAIVWMVHVYHGLNKGRPTA
jgi:CysZ protein